MITLQKPAPSGLRVVLASYLLTIVRRVALDPLLEAGPRVTPHGFDEDLTLQDAT